MSAWVPLVNAEAYVLGLAATVSPVLGWSSVAGITVGQTAGKQLMFVAARRGRESGWRWRRRRPRGGGPDGPPRPGREPRRPPGPMRRRLADWGERGLLLLDRPWPAGGVVLAAASVGVPPLAVVSVAAGIRSTSALLVAGCTLAGRAARFAVLAAPVISLSS